MTRDAFRAMRVLDNARRTLAREAQDVPAAPDQTSDRRLYFAALRYMTAYRKAAPHQPVKEYQLRRKITCRECQRVRPHAAHELCDACYRRERERARQRSADAATRQLFPETT